MNNLFKIVDHGTRRFLLLEGQWTPEVAAFMEKEGLRDLRLSAYAGWRDSSIEFLKDIPMLERLDLMTVGLRDVTPLYSLPKLRHLSVSGVKKQIDFTRIPQLEELGIGWNAKFFSSILDCDRLKVLGIERYSAKDLGHFAKFRKLEVLAVAYSPIESLEGIENLASLLRLSLAATNHVTTLGGIEACKKLTHLSIEKAKKLRRIDSVSGLYELKEIVLTACPEIQSVSPISGLPKLEYVCLLHTTRVKDGNLSVLKSLPALKHASFVNRRTYTDKTEEFPKAYRTRL